MFEVKESRINGQGLFILHSVPQGTVLFYVCDGDKKQKRDKYTVEFNDAHYDHPTLRSANHSKEGNMWLDSHGRFLALRDLEKGEELTFDYKSTEKRISHKFEGL